MQTAMTARRTAMTRTQIASWALSGFLSLFLIVDGLARVAKVDVYVEGLVKAGYPESTGPWIGLVLVACTIVYLVPRTAVLGAILLTGYLGGAVATHVRMEESNYLFAFAFGVLTWGALYLRDADVRALVGVRR